jgi:hypothetical protein
MKKPENDKTNKNLQGTSENIKKKNTKNKEESSYITIVKSVLFTFYTKFLYLHFTYFEPLTLEKT